MIQKITTITDIRQNITPSQRQIEYSFYGKYYCWELGQWQFLYLMLIRVDFYSRKNAFICISEFENYWIPQQPYVPPLWIKNLRYSVQRIWAILCGLTVKTLRTPWLHRQMHVFVQDMVRGLYNMCWCWQLLETCRPFRFPGAVKFGVLF